MARKTAKIAASKANSTATTIPRAVRANPNRASFVDLPGEIRNQIYGYLLPEATPFRGTYFAGNHSSTNSMKHSSTNFMASCRQVYEEAIDILYRGRKFEVDVCEDGEILFMGQVVYFHDVIPGKFEVLNQIEILYLTIHVVDYDSPLVCRVQDAIFAFFDSLGANHKLHTIHVHLNYSSVFENAKGRDVPGFPGIMPGDISLLHIVAFITDPLRTIRRLGHRNKKGKFTLYVAGRTGKPWRGIEIRVRNLMQSSELVPNYEVFRDYCAAFRSLSYILKDFGDGVDDYEWFEEDLAAARIRGDVQQLKVAHEGLLDKFDKAFEKEPTTHSNGSQDAVEKHEHQVREANYLMVELQRTLPHENTDTSFYGYSELDKEIREWQSHGKQQEEEKKSKQKREKEEKEASSNKKAKN